MRLQGVHFVASAIGGRAIFELGTQLADFVNETTFLIPALFEGGEFGFGLADAFRNFGEALGVIGAGCLFAFKDAFLDL